MTKRNKLTKAERSEISILRSRGCAQREIARALHRSPNTISYEVKENSTHGIYDAEKAHAKAQVDRKYRKWQWRKIEHDSSLKAYVIEKLGEHWNPDEIAGAMREERQSFFASKTAIYAWLRSVWGQPYCPLLYSQRYRKKKRKPKTKRVMIPERTSIGERPLGADHRTRYGHWEEDTVVSCRGGTGAIAVMSERKSRLILAQRLDTLSPREHQETIERMIGEVKTESITFDNGIENRYHSEIGVPTFFCDPYSSWQKGGVENANKMIRRYLPKGTNLSEVSQSELDQIVSIINRKPRKVLGYRSAFEVARAGGVIINKREGVLIEG